MSKIVMFTMQGCPYCRQAKKALQELAAEAPELLKGQEIQEIDENEQPDVANSYDYWSVPSMFLDGKKLYEAHPGESYAECKAHVKEVLQTAKQQS